MNNQNTGGVIKAFLDHKIARSKRRDIAGPYIVYKGSSISTDGDILYSYNTPIAKWAGRKVIMDGSRYSNTTSKQQYALRYAMDKAGIEYITASSVSL